VKKHNIPQKVAEVLKDIGETSKTATWDCHGTVVILHKALEKVAAHKGITFDAPVVIESCVEKKMVVILVTGRFNDKVEWSFGEAAPYNLKNNYPFAMAEKRAKDRVILKLVGLHGDAYSEIEADEFNETKPPKLVQESDEDMVSEDQIIAIKKLLDETKSNKARFLEWLKVENIDQILASNYERVIAAIEAKK
jgi:hypothetical protein